MRRALLTLAFAALLASGCGSDDSEPGESLAADLRVVVRPEGPAGPERVRRIECERLGKEADDSRCRALGGLDAESLAPVPRRTACTQIYGGPATARVTGKLRGKPVSASFDLTDGCDIERWRRNSALLGPLPGRRGAPPS